MRSTKFHRPWSGPYTLVQALPNNVYTKRPPTTLNARLTTVYFIRFKRYAARRTAPTPTRSPGSCAGSLGVAYEDLPEDPAHINHLRPKLHDGFIARS